MNIEIGKLLKGKEGKLVLVFNNQLISIRNLPKTSIWSRKYERDKKEHKNMNFEGFIWQGLLVKGNRILMDMQLYQTNGTNSVWINNIYAE